MGRLGKRKLASLFLVLLIAAVAAALLAGAGVGGYYAFASWRAKDLAKKARVNFENKNYRMAWLQISSAREMSPDSPEVLRVSGLIEAAIGRASALDYYDKLGRSAELTPEDLLARAEVATRFGNDRQFIEAIGALEKSGNSKGTGNLRAMRRLRSGDIDNAVAEARLAITQTDYPALKLMLARLLEQRYGLELSASRTPGSEAQVASREITGIVNSLLDTPLKSDALAFGLVQVQAPPETRAAWAEAAMSDLRADNPALLPGATAMLTSGKKNAADINKLLRLVFDAAPLDRRAAYCLWLTGAGMPKEALTLLTAQEAGESTAAFGARTEALFALNNPEAVLAACESGGNMDEDVKLSAKARAEYALGRGMQSGAKSLADAMKVAARARRLVLMLPSVDQLGAGNVADQTITELCGDPALVDYALPIARDRLSRRGKASMLAQAFDRAKTASPSSTAVQDYDRYQRLLKGESVDLSQTAAAMAANPADQNLRITHALALLRTGKPAEAVATFNDTTLFADTLPPGQFAVIAAILAASGDTANATSMARVVDVDLLGKEEYALIAPLRVPSPSQKQ